MQLLFGVIGETSAASSVFERLMAGSIESNPGLAPIAVTAPGIRVGHTSRAFTAWGGGTGGTIHLSGQVLAIDGRDTTHAGTADDELEALFQLFRSEGAAAWSRVDGPFCAVILDGPVAHLGVDVAGTHAVYWWYQDDLLAFHSHLVDLAPTYPGPLREHQGAIGAYLGCGQYPPGTTPFREIRHLGAGQCLSVQGGRVAERDHFTNVFLASPERASADQLADELAELVSMSVSRRWRAARRPGVPLSGGLDSRYITAELVSQVQDRQAVRTITWGEDRTRAGSDAAIAVEVAAMLDVQNTWYEKAQRPTPEDFDRAVYLSSGEADCAIHYPVDHQIHTDLVERSGFASLFRGDESSGNYQFVTNRAGAAEYLFVRVALREGFRHLLAWEMICNMAEEQTEMIEADVRRLQSRTPQDKAAEIYYSHWLRRTLGPYNVVKNAELDVFNPYLDRRILELMKRTPGHLRTEKKDLVLLALRRRHPEIAALPFATTGNLPSWRRRFRFDPEFPRLYRDLCSRPGWLDSIGARPAVFASIDAMEHAAATATATPAPTAPSRRKAIGDSWRESAKHTTLGKLIRELTLEHRYASHQPEYLRVARLLVLDRMLGSIQQRRSAPVAAHSDAASPREAASTRR